jgi:acyl-CoA synthetase (AMP-forming)/AMP-acid ligase II
VSLAENPFRDKTYAQSIEILAERYGDATALVFEGRRYSFRDVKHEVDRASARLGTLGLGPGDTLALWMPNRPEFLWYWFGAAQIGLVPVFLNTRLRREEYVYQIAQSESRALLVPGQGAFRDFLGEILEICPELRQGRPGALGCAAFPNLRYVIAVDRPADPAPGILDWSAPFTGGKRPPVATDPTKPALIAYSSGTTALPKGAMLTHCIWRKGFEGGSFLDLSPEDSLYLCVPLFGIMGALAGILTFWTHGAAVVLDTRFDVDRALETLARERCTAMHLLPVMVNAMLEHPRFAEYDLSRLRVGTVLSNDPKVLERAATRLGLRGVGSGYGLTETTGVVTRYRWDDPLELRLSAHGFPLPDCRVRVVDPETGRDLPPGETGEIWIAGYSIMAGYYNKPEETRKAITPDGWLRSGDAGFMREDGSLVFKHRLADGYKHKGFNVSTVEVERVAAEHPDVESVAVVDLPDPVHGAVGVAFVIPRQGRAFAPESLMEFLAPRLSSFKLPAHVLVIDRFPVTGGTAKVQKFRLREIARERLGLPAS